MKKIIFVFLAILLLTFINCGDDNDNNNDAGNDTGEWPYLPVDCGNDPDNWKTCPLIFDSGVPNGIMCNGVCSVHCSVSNTNCPAEQVCHISEINPDEGICQ